VPTLAAAAPVTVAMPDDIAGEAPSRPETPAPQKGEPALHWRLIERLESTAIGQRAADGAIAVRLRESAGCFFYGPYLQLPEGAYRLTFRCRSGTPRLTAQPVLGVEIIVLSRFQEEWRDFTAADLASETGSLDFVVSAEHSLEGENEGRFEFRFFHLGNADLTVTAVDLERLPPEQMPRKMPRQLPNQMSAAAPRLWRLLGRLGKSWLGRRAGDGTVTVRRIEPAGLLLYGGWPYLRLPRGHYRLTLRARAGRLRGSGGSGRSGRPVLGIAVFGQNRWLSRRPLMRLLRRPETNGPRLAGRDITAEEIAGGPVSLDFVVPTQMALEAGVDAPFDIRLHHFGNASLALYSVDLLKLDDDQIAAAPQLSPAPALAPQSPRLRPSGRRKIVIIGNCQSETLRQGFNRIESLNRLFDVTFHFVQLPKNLHEFAARDLEACDILLVQDIRLWDQFPLRDCVRPGAEILKFPLVRLASLWPFDAWNGPGDKEAHDREAPNLTFPYLDGLLGRLRREIPDREARFAAYRSLELPEGLPGVINYRRLHQIEMRRLAAMDKGFGSSIGGFIMENFQKRRIFHTTVRPNWEVFALLMQYVADLVGAREPITLAEGIDAVLRNPQVPVHPKVARDLGVTWADERTRYLNRGREITWESYIRLYIDHYG
jgi:Polysaccharide biosynthesis enzyme WcbI